MNGVLHSQNRTYTSALEKHILQGSGIPKPYFLGIQRSKCWLFGIVD